MTMLLAPMPEIFQVEITNYCNLACTFCPHPSLVRPKMHMTVEQFKVIRQYFYPGQRVGIYLLGEPLMHPKFYALVQLTQSVGAIPEIATNGLTLTSDKARSALLQAGLGRITIDITHWKERPERMDIVMRNVEYLVEQSLAAAHPETQLAFQLVYHKDHPENFPSWLKIAAEVVPNKIVLQRKFLDTWAGQKTELYDVTDVQTPTERAPCAEPWHRVAILVNGDVVPCCRDAQGWTVYGNIFQQSLKEIWHSAVVEGIREDMLLGQWGNLPEPCKSCREWHIPMDRYYMG